VPSANFESIEQEIKGKRAAADNMENGHELDPPVMFFRIFFLSSESVSQNKFDVIRP